MNIYDSTIEAPESGFVVGLIDYLDPTHSAVTYCDTRKDAEIAARELLAEYEPYQIVVVGAGNKEYTVFGVMGDYEVALEAMF